MSNMREPGVRNPMDPGVTAALRDQEQRAIGLSVQRIATRIQAAAAAEAARALEPEPEQTADTEPEQQQLEDAAEMMHIMNEVVLARAAEADLPSPVRTQHPTAAPWPLRAAAQTSASAEVWAALSGAHPSRPQAV